MRRRWAPLLGVILLAAHVPTAMAADPLPSMLFEFEASSSYIGEPESVSETAPSASFIFNGYRSDDPRVGAVIYGVTATWTIILRPAEGEQLGVGSYPDAAPDATTEPEIRVTRASRSCTPGEGSGFEIHELTRDGTGFPRSIALSFRFVCDDSFGTMVGRLRINSTLPLPSLSVPHIDRVFGGIATGTTRTRSFPLEANGDLPVTVTDIDVGGAAQGDFIVNDDCSGTRLDPGENCVFDVTFAPSALGNRLAFVTIEHDGAVSPITLRLIGAGLAPTTTIASVEPETAYFNPGMLYVGTVTPNPAAGDADIWIDGVLVLGGVNPQGRITVAEPRTTGPHTVQVHFLGTNTHAESWSAPYSFTVSATTSTTLTPGPGSIASGTPITFEATVNTGGGLIYSGGTVTIRDMTQGKDLISGAVDYLDPTVSVTVTLADGSHDIRARYSGITGLLNGSSTTQRITVGASPTATPTPVPTATPTPTATPAPTGQPDTDPPDGAVAVVGDVTNSTFVTVSAGATDSGSGVDQVALSNDGTTWTTRAYAPTQAWTLQSTNGMRTVYAKWRDVAGNWSAVATDTVVLDTTPPTATAPTWRLVNGSAISGGRTTVRLGWTGSDATSGIDRYELAQSTDGGSWTSVSTALTATSLDRALGHGHAYRFRVRAVDAAGNVGAWMAGPTFRLTHFGESSASVTYTGSWSISTSSAYWGGKAKASGQAGAKASLTFTGRSVEVVSRKGPARGKAQIYINGVLKATVDLYASSYQNQRVVWTGSWSSSAKRTITVRVVGTSGRPRVDLDAFVVGS